MAPDANINIMTEVHSYKPLEQAILEGEKEVKVTTPKFLIACAVAEKCIADPSFTNKLIGLVMDQRKGNRQFHTETTFTLLGDKGKSYTQRVTLTSIADAINIIKILDGLYASIKLQKDDDGHLTGVMDIVTR